MTDAGRLALRRQLVRHEAIRLRLYLDTEGQWTWGVGYNVTGRGLGPLCRTLGREVTLEDLREGRLTREDAFAQLEADIDESVRDLATFPWFLQLGVVRQRVLVDMRLNLGPVRFRGFKRMIAALARGDYGAAADEMVDSRWFRQVKTRGVTLVRWMRTGLDV
jgi:lysozyme